MLNITQQHYNKYIFLQCIHIMETNLPHYYICVRMTSLNGAYFVLHYLDTAALQCNDVVSVCFCIQTLRVPSKSEIIAIIYGVCF